MRSASEKFYDRLAVFYPAIDLFLKPQKRTLIRLINTLPEGKLLEIGIGTGSHLKDYSGHIITGIDVSERMLARAHKQHHSNLVTLLKMGASSLSFADNTFDYVVLSHVIAVVPDATNVMNEVHRVLKPGGKVFILNHFTPDNAMKYIDRAFENVMKLFHVRSVFPVSALAVDNLRLIEEHTLPPFSYFKILIYEKGL